MAKRKTAKKREFKVYRYWTVEYRSVSHVKAETVEEAIKLALDDDDYSDSAAVDGSDGPTEVGKVVEIVRGGEVEHEISERAQP